MRLPIDEHLDEIVTTLKERGRLVLAAEPGAGKTTRVPPAMLRAGFGERGEIVVVEPRRIAARSAAKRVAKERRENVGEVIGYSVRFDTKASAKTKVRYVTEGVFMRQVTSGKLAKMGAVVFDEFHERHLDSDLGLALAKAAGSLPIVVMSATLNADPIATYLGAPTIQVKGRAFPVEVSYVPPERDERIEKSVLRALRTVGEQDEGDVLVFLPGAGEIRRTEEAIKNYCARHDMDIALLHGELPPDRQDKALRPGERRRVILSTNIAETSVTIPSVTTVIDSGLARFAACSPWTGLPTLLTKPISRASAKQRAGRAGRTQAGRCARLYPKFDHDRRHEFDVPEIKRADLASLILTLRGLGHDPTTFPYFVPPDDAARDRAVALMTRLGALDEAGELTEDGRAMLRAPAHPRVTKLALEAAKRGAGARGCWLGALLSEREPRLRFRAFGRDRVVADVGTSDLLARLMEIEEAEANGGLSERNLRQAGLDARVVRTAERASQSLARALSIDVNEIGSLYDEEEALLRATLCAFPDRVGQRRAARSARVVFADGGAGELSERSVVRESMFFVAFDVSERPGKVDIRGASEIEPDWLLEELFDDVVDDEVVRFDAGTERVVSARALRFGNVVLEERDTATSLSEETARVMCAAAKEKGLARLFDLDELESHRRRALFAASHGVALTVPEGDALDEVLLACCRRGLSFADLRKQSLVQGHLDTLSHATRTAFEAVAPTHVKIAGRARVPVRYEVDRAPWIESRLQDFFSMKDGPTVARGAVPLVLHLLAPNKRAVQVTTDLAGFWDRHYPSVRKELMRRYRRHAWPEDPRTATPPPRRGRRK